MLKDRGNLWHMDVLTQVLKPLGLFLLKYHSLIGEYPWLYMMMIYPIHQLCLDLLELTLAYQMVLLFLIQKKLILYGGSNSLLSTEQACNFGVEVHGVDKDHGGK